MAFNPFGNFRKYQKIWMATILLLCMITFVLCTGTRGDFMEWVLSITRSKGTVIAKIDGRNIYHAELSDLKQRRNAANEFMTKARVRVAEKLDEHLKLDSKQLEARDSDPKKREQKMMVANELRA